MDKTAIILTSIGFTVGVGEALIYYNMGQAAGKGFRFKMPPTKEFLKTAGVVLVTSLITTALFKGLELVMEPSSDNLIADNQNKK